MNQDVISFFKHHDYIKVSFNTVGQKQQSSCEMCSNSINMKTNKYVLSLLGVTTVIPPATTTPPTSGEYRSVYVKKYKILYI